MRVFRKLHGRIKRSRHRFGGDMRHYFPEWRISWRASVRTRGKVRLMRMTVVEAFRCDDAWDDLGDPHNGIMPKVVSCGLEPDPVRRDDFLFIRVTSPLQRPRFPRRHKPISPRPWRPKRSLVLLIDELIADAGRTTF